MKQKQFVFFFVILFIAFCVPFVSRGAFGDTWTYVSRPYYGDDKPATQAFFDFPEDIDINDEGGFVLADTYNHVIRRIKANGQVTTLAGNASYGDRDGGKEDAEFSLPKGVDVAGGVVYVADSDNGKIKKIANGVVTTLVSGLNNPEGVRAYKNTLYFLDTDNNALKKVSVNGGTVTTITSALNKPKKMDITTDGKIAYIANSGTYQIKQVNLQTGVVTTLAGTGEDGLVDGKCSKAKFRNVWGVHLYDENTLYVSDGNGYNDFIRKIDLDSCFVSVFASDSGMISVNYPRGLTSDKGYLYVASTGISIIQKYNVSDPDENSKFAGADRFNVKERKPVLVGNPKYMVLSKNKKWIYFSENNRIRRIARVKRNQKVRRSKLIAGSVVDYYNFNKGGDTATHSAEDTRFSSVTSMALSKNGKKLFVVDRNNNRIREVVLATKKTGYLTGAGITNANGSQANGFDDGKSCPNEFDTGVSGCAYFNRPMGSVLSKNGKYLFITDTGNNLIRKVYVRGKNKGKVTTLAGSGQAGYQNGVGTAASFHSPIGITRSKSGKYLYVVDRDNHVIRKINVRTREVTTLAGKGVAGNLDGKFVNAMFSYPEWITRGANGRLYVSESGSQKIRLLDRKVGVTKLVTGSTRGYAHGSRTTTRLDNPKGMLALGKKTLLVAEMYNDIIRGVDVSGEAPYTESAPVVHGLTQSIMAKEWFADGKAFPAVEIRGKNFRYGAVAYIGSHKAVKTYVDSANGKIVAEMPIEKMGSGRYSIRVENVDGQYSQINNAFSLSENGVVSSYEYNY
ncbi:MAG TPA: hypothetical protein VJB65_00035 [Patescibacteria group bacterium]|nr:hypothetical protein [Patescibacteria group bacterium]